MKLTLAEIVTALVLFVLAEPVIPNAENVVMRVVAYVVLLVVVILISSLLGRK